MRWSRSSVIRASMITTNRWLTFSQPPSSRPINRTPTPLASCRRLICTLRPSSDTKSEGSPWDAESLSTPLPSLTQTSPSDWSHHTHHHPFAHNWCPLPTPSLAGSYFTTVLFAIKIIVIIICWGRGQPCSSMNHLWSRVIYVPLPIMIIIINFYDCLIYYIWK